MESFAFMIVGWAAGLLCRFVVPNPRPLGLISMLLIGMVGGLFGGTVGGSFQSGMEIVSIRVPSLLGAFLSGLLAVFVVLRLSRTRAHV